MELRIVFRTDDKVPSLNQFYKNSHWKARKEKSDGISKLIDWSIFEQASRARKLGFADRMEVDLRYNSRLDVDNPIPLAKEFSDSLKRSGVIKDDKNKIYSRLTMQYDESLPRGSYVIEAKLFYAD